MTSKEENWDRIKYEFERVASLMNVVYRFDKNAFIEAFARSYEPIGDVPMDWLKAKLDKIDNNDALSKIFAKPEMVERMVEHGYRSWVVSKLSKMNDNEFIRVLTDETAAVNLVGGGEKMYFNRVRTMDDKTLRKLLSIDGAARLFVDHPKGNQAIDRLSKLENDDITKVLQTTHAVWEIAEAGYGEWLTAKIDTLPHAHQVGILSAGYAAEGLMAHGQADWLKKKIDTFNFWDTLQVARRRHNFTYGTEGFEEYIVNEVQNKPHYMRRPKPSANPS